jgi:hypothetical protein
MGWEHRSERANPVTLFHALGAFGFSQPASIVGPLEPLRAVPSKGWFCHHCPGEYKLCDCDFENLI